jgi:hypothetical protein
MKADRRLKGAQYESERSIGGSKEENPNCDQKSARDG